MILNLDAANAEHQPPKRNENKLTVAFNYFLPTISFVRSDEQPKVFPHSCQRPKSIKPARSFPRNRANVSGTTFNLIGKEFSIRMTMVFVVRLHATIRMICVRQNNALSSDSHRWISPATFKPNFYEVVSTLWKSISMSAWLIEAPTRNVDICCGVSGRGGGDGAGPKRKKMLLEIIITFSSIHHRLDKSFRLCFVSLRKCVWPNDNRHLLSDFISILGRTGVRATLAIDTPTIEREWLGYVNDITKIARAESATNRTEIQYFVRRLLPRPRLCFATENEITEPESKEPNSRFHSH